MERLAIVSFLKEWPAPAAPSGSRAVRHLPPVIGSMSFNVRSLLSLSAFRGCPIRRLTATLLSSSTPILAQYGSLRTLTAQTLRILFVSDVYFPRVNGVSTSIQTFRRELSALGHDTVLVAPQYPAPHPDEPGIVRIPSRRVPLDPEDRAMHWTHLRRQHKALAGERFDLVHIQTPFLAHYAGLSLARRWGIPAVATYHTLFEEYLYHYAKLAPRGAMRALARGCSRSQCNALDAVLVPSIAMRETL